MTVHYEAGIVTDEGSDAIVVADVLRAASLWAKTRGINGLPERTLSDGQGLLLPGAKLIDMLGCKQPLDLVFCDRKGRIVKLVEAIRPGLHCAFSANARFCLELPAGSIETLELEPGRTLKFTPSSVTLRR